MPTPKEHCQSCAALPEGEVVEGHDHRVKPLAERLSAIEDALLELAGLQESGEWIGSKEKIYNILYSPIR